MRERGFEKEFKHPTGHGVGFVAIDHNARPRIHPVSEDVLEAGMVFNLEPGIYIEGVGGAALRYGCRDRERRNCSAISFRVRSRWKNYFDLDLRFSRFFCRCACFRDFARVFIRMGRLLLLSTRSRSRFDGSGCGMLRRSSFVSACRDMLCRGSMSTPLADEHSIRLAHVADFAVQVEQAERIDAMIVLAQGGVPVDLIGQLYQVKPRIGTPSCFSRTMFAHSFHSQAGASSASLRLVSVCMTGR